MKLTYAFFVLIVGSIFAQTTSLTPSSQPSIAAYFDNSANVIPANPPWSGALNEKLAAFKTARGITFLVSLHAKAPPADEDKIPGAYMRSLATKLGTAQSGILAVYFADDDDWRLWIGDDLTAQFSGQTGTPKELTKSGAIHDAKEALFAAAAAKRDTAFAALQKTAPADQPPSPARRLQFHTEALIEEMIKKFPNK